MDTVTSSNEDPSSVDAVTKAAEKHGIPLTTDQARMGAEWRGAMAAAVDAVRRLDVAGYEPAAVFSPVAHSKADIGG